MHIPNSQNPKIIHNLEEEEVNKKSSKEIEQLELLKRKMIMTTKAHNT
jgi:hypothetical protein